MTLNVFPNSQLGGDNDLLSQARSGAIEICQPDRPDPRIHPSALRRPAMGFAFDSYDKVWPAIDGELGKFVRTQVAAKVNLVPMEKIWDLGFRQITNSIRPIKSAADLSGMKLRVPGAPSLVSLFKALGSHPVSMQFGEVYTSLQTKVVDGQENPLSQIDAGKFYEVQKYCLDQQPRLGRALDHLQQGRVGAPARRHQDHRGARLQRGRARAARRGRAAQQRPAGRAGKEGARLQHRRDAELPRHARKAGFYKEWRGKLGEEAWTLLEKQVGKLG